MASHQGRSSSFVMVPSIMAPRHGTSMMIVPTVLAARPRTSMVMAPTRMYATSIPRKDCCRLCNKLYVTKNDCRFNLFSKKYGNLSIVERLLGVNIVLSQEPGHSESICRSCERKIHKLEVAKHIKESWKSQGIQGVKQKSEPVAVIGKRLWQKNDEVIEKEICRSQLAQSNASTQTTFPKCDGCTQKDEEFGPVILRRGLPVKQACSEGSTKKKDSVKTSCNEIKLELDDSVKNEMHSTIETTNSPHATQGVPAALEERTDADESSSHEIEFEMEAASKKKMCCSNGITNKPHDVTKDSIVKPASVERMETDKGSPSNEKTSGKMSESSKEIRISVGNSDRPPNAAVGYNPLFSEGIPFVTPTTSNDSNLVLTTLQGVEVRKSTVLKNGLGVFATQLFPKGTSLGPYEGKKTDSTFTNNNGKISFMWKIMVEGKIMYGVDAKDEKYGNWMRLINHVNSGPLGNVVSFKDKGQVWYKTGKDIRVGEEFLVCESQKNMPEEIANTPAVVVKPLKVVGQEAVSSEETNEEIGTPIDIGPIFTCSYCQKTFSTETFLTKHLKYCNEMRAMEREKPNECDICGKKLSSKSHLQRHAKIHSGVKPFKCDVCERRFTDSFELKVHHRIHTGEKPFECDICGKRFRRSNYLKDHLLTHSNLKPYKCDICNKKFARRPTVKTHLLKIHKEDKCNICGKVLVDVKTLKIHSCKKDTEKRLQCNICACQFDDASTLEAHASKHNDEMCSTYDKRTAENTNLQMDAQTPAGSSQYKCDSCGKAFQFKKEYNGHACILTEDKPHKCGVCSKRFTHSSYLQNHLRIHARKKSHPCDICGKVFSQKYRLNNHLHQHTGEKPYKCDNCGKAFSSRSSWVHHKWSHSKEKPFKCSFCGKTFSASSSFRLHIMRHVEDKSARKVVDSISSIVNQTQKKNSKRWKEHRCGICGKGFNVKDSFLRHVAEHKGEAPFKCGTCGKGFKRRYPYEIHILTHTGETPRNTNT